MIDKLQVKGQGDAHGLWSVTSKKTIVIPPTVAHPATVPVEDGSWHNNHIKLSGIKAHSGALRRDRFRNVAISGCKIRVRIGDPDDLQGVMGLVCPGNGNDGVPLQEPTNQWHCFNFAPEVDIDKNRCDLSEFRQVQECRTDLSRECLTFLCAELIPLGQNVASKVVITGHFATREMGLS